MIDWVEVEADWPATRAWEAELGEFTLSLVEWEDDDLDYHHYHELSYGLQFWGPVSDSIRIYDASNFEEAVEQTEREFLKYCEQQVSKVEKVREVIEALRD